MMNSQPTGLSTYLDECRSLVLDEIRTIVPSDSCHTGGLYELMLDYPLRHGKALRPALSIAVCRATGGALSAVLPTAAVLELYHNAFLIHDDVEDESERRRYEATLNRLHGVPTAINVGDGMLALSIRPLLDNIGLIGLGKALKILRLVVRMATETAEGQMIELGWIRSVRWSQSDADYIRLVYKKTSWYSFITPIMVGGIAAGLPDAVTFLLGRIAIPLGVAFQIQDDILDLTAGGSTYAKDFCGDLWEGKHTLILIHALRCASEAERAEALRILRKSRPDQSNGTAGLGAARHAGECRVGELLDELAAQGELGPKGHQCLRRALDRSSRSSESRTEYDVATLKRLVERYDSVHYAWEVARVRARRFQRALHRVIRDWPASIHRDFLAELGDFVIRRNA